MLFLKWRTCGYFLLVWVNCPPISKGNLEKTFFCACKDACKF